MKRSILLLFAVALSFSQPAAAQPAAVGSPAPSIAALLPGTKLPDTKGKVVLVDFWASWCAPCKASFPTMAALHRKYSAKGLVILGVGIDEDAAKYRSFVATQKAPFTLVHDAKHQVAARFKPATMPTSYLIDRKGRIRHIHKGFKGATTAAEYTREIEALLAE